MQNQPMIINNNNEPISMQQLLLNAWNEYQPRNNNNNMNNQLLAPNINYWLNKLRMNNINNDYGMAGNAGANVAARMRLQ